MLQISRWNLRYRFYWAGVLTAMVLAGCNTCFVAFSNNGTGGVIIKSGNSSAACSVPQPMGKMSVTAREAVECSSCATGARIAHVFVTLQSMRIRPETPADADPAEWIELAPAFARNPHQFDLADDSSSDGLVRGVIVPAGTYQELQMNLFSGQQKEGLQLPIANACGEGRWNCVMTDDGRVEPLYGATPEVVVPFEAMHGTALVVLPDSSVDVQVNWAPQLALALDAAGLKAQHVIAGTVEVKKQSTAEDESAAPD